MATMRVVAPEVAAMKVAQISKPGGDFEIVEVSNGDAAIKPVEELRPSVVLADIYMPGTNGATVIAELKRGHPEIPVIAISGLFTFGWTGSVLVSIMTDFGKLDATRAKARKD